MSRGIREVSTAADRAAFAAAVAGKPFFGALFGRDLALWAGNAGAPTKLYTLPDAALAISGRSAQLCGAVQNWEELVLFLQFAGVEKLTADRPAPLPPLQTLHLYGLAVGQSLPLVSKEPPAGLRLQTAPAIGPVADLLFPEPARAARRDAFYSETCTAVAHGLARVWALETPEGALVSTVGAYAMAGGEAYMACGETIPTRRGQGIGGWLIPALANALAAEGWQVRFLCADNRRPFYERHGFVHQDVCLQYRIPTNEEGITET